MRISASSTYDRETVRDMTRFMLFRNRKQEPRKRMIMWTVLFCALMGTLIAEMVLWGFSAFTLVLVLLCAGILLLEWFFYLRLPEIQYKNAGKVADAKNEFVFTETGLEASSTASEYSGSSEMEYDTLYKIYETEAYLFLYLNKRQCFVVDKATIQGGTAEELRGALIEAVGNRYVRCEY
ncbi:MAG: YcxB family protein [Oscillospiraceae bacterium]|nr:YcxB family protein [Oscillospiraceae bacterium]